ncbi:hypothetical protein [uncultured Marinobacter sp.]|uniref:hypothetical protein n=1 Tax=uncultured Marinobacter sp. TaxID=187379 RepID=UPI0030D8F771|tara:strand:- start:441 stop:815 length:375 start_codon:yes stop_codon:yes gene_type:complete
MTSSFPITRFLGRALFFLARIAAIFLSLSLLAIPFNRNGFQEISNGLYAPGAPLMGSNLLDFLMQPWLAAVLGLGMLIYVYARFWLISADRRRISDLSYLATVALLMMGIQVALYLPAIQAPAL